jgi:DNA-binding response OmpR family regulator
MHRKSIVLITNALKLPDTANRVLSSLDVSVNVATPADYRSLIASKTVDLVIVDLGNDMMRELPKIQSYLFEDGPISALILTEVEYLEDFRLPMRITADFIIKQASEEEYATRLRQLLWPGEEASSADFIRIDTMTVNLATYQVTIGGEPVDLTYLEYALFAFLVTHPGRTYSRDALLRRVWGFEYYGGSRTVDVHVRRVRAKLGPDLSQRLETVRGVGYLWNA